MAYKTWLMESAESIYPHYDACNVQRNKIFAVWKENYDCYQDLLLAGFQVARTAEGHLTAMNPRAEAYDILLKAKHQAND